MKKKIASIFVFMVAILCILGYVFYPKIASVPVSQKSVKYSEFLSYVDHRKADDIKINGNEITFNVDDVAYITQKATDHQNLAEYLHKAKVPFEEKHQNKYVKTAIDFMPTIIMISVLFFGFNKFSDHLNGTGSGNKKTSEVSMSDRANVTFADIKGQDEAKESLSDIVDFLKHPAKYKNIGAKLPKGVLLIGPPGTGKTLLAKAVAGESNVPFFSLSGSDFVEVFVGMGAKKVRNLFNEAKEKSPCIIFIDEIDAIAQHRGGQGNQEYEHTLNSILAEIDGFDSGKPIVIIAATNRPDSLDQALLRPGRFDRKVFVGKPDLSGREDILRYYLDKTKYDKVLPVREVALMTAGATGADLANIVNEAAINVIKDNRKEIKAQDLINALESIYAGKQKKGSVLMDDEKEIVAYHETGHAMLMAHLKGIDQVSRISIVPRTNGPLGYTMESPKENQAVLFESEVIANIIVLLAGRCAEEVVFGAKSTGAQNDIQRATDIARDMIATYGFSRRFGMFAVESVSDSYLGSRNSTSSKDTLAKLDEEVIYLLKACHKFAYDYLSKNVSVVHEIAKTLLRVENLSKEDVRSLFNQFSIKEISVKNFNVESFYIKDDNLPEPIVAPKVLTPPTPAPKEKPVSKVSIKKSVELKKPTLDDDNGIDLEDLLNDSIPSEEDVSEDNEDLREIDLSEILEADEDEY